MKIAIVMPNWVGDCIMTLPALLFLQQKNYQIYLYGKKWLPELFQSLTKNIYLLEDLSSFKEIGKYCILFPNSFQTALKTRLAKLKPIGYRRDGRSLLLHKSFARKKKHESEIFYRLAILSHTFLTEKKKLKQVEKEIIFKSKEKYFLPIQKKFDKKAETLLEGVKNYFLLCPLSHNKGHGKSKNYPHWKKLLIELIKDYPKSKFVFCPGPTEHDDIVNLIGELKKNSKIKIIENTTLGEYIALLRKANLVIANDSGPMHLASVSSVPVIGLFGVTDPEKTKPIGNKGYFLGSKNNWIKVEEILLKVKSILD